ncbi:24154_t:CDS:2 [Gigaspora rosea]|nr:24154_t:CDS:2 [Gigaspora rosea]
MQIDTNKGLNNKFSFGCCFFVVSAVHSALKCNKNGKSSAQKISISPNQPNNHFKPINDILYLISFHPEDACKSLFLETTQAKKGIKKTIPKIIRTIPKTVIRTIPKTTTTILKTTISTISKSTTRTIAKSITRTISKTTKLFQRSFQKLSEKISEKLKSKLYMLFKLSLKASNDQPTNIPLNIRNLLYIL